MEKNAWIGDLFKVIVWVAIFVSEVNFNLPLKISCWIVLIPIVILYVTKGSFMKLVELLFTGVYLCLIIISPDSLLPQFMLALMFAWSLYPILLRFDDQSKIS